MSPTHYLARLQLTRPVLNASAFTTEETAILSQHVRWLRHQAEEGGLILAGRTSNEDEQSLSIVIFNAASQEDANKLLNSDPAIEQGVIHAELFPFDIHVLAGGDV
jgi:uncharacterized protein YciI